MNLYRAYMSQTDNKDTLKRSGMSDQVFRKRYPLGGGVDRKAVDIEEGTFEGHSAGIGNRDRGDDVIMPGAFHKTIKEKVPTGDVKLLNGHQSRSTENVWGRVTKAEERELSPDQRERIAKRIGAEKEETPTHVLWSKFNVSNRQTAQEALQDVSDGILDGLSIGFKTVQIEFEKDENADEDMDAEMAWLMGQGIRKIHELAWWETSLVTWGMNRSARVVPGSVKSVVERAGLINDLGADEVDEKRVRYTIRALKQLLGDSDVCGGILDTDGAQRACEAVDSSLSKAEEADAGGTEELAELRDDLSERKDDAETADSQVIVDEDLDEEKALSEARSPTWTGGLEPERSWGDVSKGWGDYWRGWFDVADDISDEWSPDEVPDWDEAPQSARDFTASRTLLGDPEADTSAEGIVLPVVSPDTDALNRGAVEAAKAAASGARGADYSPQQEESATNVANNLLEEEFDVDVEEEESSVDTDPDEKEVDDDVEETSSETQEDQKDGDVETDDSEQTESSQVTATIEMGGQKIEISASSEAQLADILSRVSGDDDMKEEDSEETEAEKAVSEDENTEETEEEKSVSENDQEDDPSSSESSEEKETPEADDDEVAGDAGDGRSDERFDEEVASRKLAELRHKKRKIFSIGELKQE